MMAEIKWIKITTNIFEDEKIKVIEKMPEGETILVVWLKLLTLAGKKNDQGLVYLTETIPYTPEILSDIFNRDSRIISLALNTFVSFGMIAIEDDLIRVLNWEKHQNVEGMDKIREQNRQRNIKYRERKKLEARDVTVTQHDGTDKNRLDKDNKYNIERGKQVENDFNEFWKAYPRKVGKPNGLKAFKKKYKSLPSMPELISIVNRLKKTEQWRDVKYIPHPATWLNDERWNDDIPEPWVDPAQEAADASKATRDVFWYKCPDCGRQQRTIGARDKCPVCGEYGVSWSQMRGKDYPPGV